MGDNAEDFREGDIMQLLVSTAWHAKGELAIIKKITSNFTMDVIYENDAESCTAIISNFRKLPIKLLEMKLATALKTNT